ncbi:MAG: hypothetical protein A3B34_01980 [Candidatus Sungbacteria bacterium RIFCSPLOWO2_01_FULL_54_21]|uniref:Uncharacterized protein n=2 Tax=Candidatus Sungiibacteriota TaxID=1817917 RepID=A0A1G2L8E1_9BACT|nr:MAG: hypothetical protein A2679_01480 [Candidatus Sungbacteria bacterium RIFCSPHIGHO2_01_FULL_54_26]OHA03273.1 MAG: hypothetical protein A3C92_03315 [Candidatus Sungbacteria bacterium RIFCSPHIGHO2_02_FULL_53_17]OHA07091.1 MAG: hypothetical protein A3B34_01980 [Candidatus Sungbacteria bacterium RIFCSPLOWO2_01_FULL_54_21]
MDLVEFLQELTGAGMGLTGTHPQYGLKYELRLSEAFVGRKNAVLIIWSDEQRSPEFPVYTAYATLDVRSIDTVGSMRRMAEASMSALIEAEAEGVCSVG